MKYKGERSQYTSPLSKTIKCQFTTLADFVISVEVLTQEMFLISFDRPLQLLAILKGE